MTAFAMRRYHIVLYVVVLLLVSGCTGRAAPSVGPLVTISAPRHGEQVPTGEVIEFVSVASDSVTPIQRIELWVDGVLIGDTSTSAEEQLHQFTATHEWVFEESHTATVEAFAYNIANQRSPAATIQLRVEGPPPTTEVVASPTPAEEEVPVAEVTEEAPTPPPEPTATATPEPPTVVGRVAVPPGVNVRAGPGTNSPRVGGLLNNNEVVGIGRNEVGDWVKIRYEGGEGWVVARFINWSADINLLPVLNE